MDVMFLLKQISDKLQHNADAEMKRLNLTYSQNHVLHILNEAGGSLPQKEIECKLQVAHPTVVGLISRLKKNDFVSTEVDPADHRNRIVSVTPKARMRFADLQQHKEEFDNKLRQVYTEEEFKQLCYLLTKMLDAINSKPRVD